MKKKIISALLVATVVLVIMAGCGSNQADLPNPWTESDKQGVEDATGFEMTAPDGADEVAYSYMSENGMAQMSFVLDRMKWTYRMQKANELTDISGMEYGWTSQEAGTVSGKNAMYYAYKAPDNGEDTDVMLVNWYDEESGVAYSLSVLGKASGETDIQAYAEMLYNCENEISSYFLGVFGRSDDKSTLTISDNNDGTFKVDINIVRLCTLQDGVGTFGDHKMTFEVVDPSENKMYGVIYKESDNSLTVEITDSTWTLLPSGEVLKGFVKGE